MKDIIFAFDLDGTICDYGRDVPLPIAEELNKLDKVYIITGGTRKQAKKQTALVKNRVIFGMRDIQGNFSLDLSEVLGIDKTAFMTSLHFQEVRKNLVALLRQGYNTDRIYIGGRSTIDFMPTINKGNIVKTLQVELNKRLVYFYDSPWPLNSSLINDQPAIQGAWMSVETSPNNFLEDFRKCLKKISLPSQEGLILSP